MLTLDELPPEAAGPGFLASKWDLARFRWRVCRMAWRYRRPPSFLELLGVALGIVGAYALLPAVLGAIDAPLPLLVGVGTIAILAVGYVAYRRFARLPRLFKAAARDAAGVRDLQNSMRRGMSNDAAFTVLGRIYWPIIASVNRSLEGGSRRIHSVVSCERSRVLAVVIPAQPGENLADLLSDELRPGDDEWSLRTSQFGEDRQRYIRALRAQEAHGNHPGDEEGNNLVLEELGLDPVSGDLRLQASHATYGQIVRTGDSLLNEFALFAHVVRDRAKELGVVRRAVARVPRLRFGRPVDLRPRDALKVLEWRRTIHGWSPTPYDLILRPTGRAAGLGVAVAMVRTEDHTARTAYVARRSSKVGTYPDALHVLPSGMCNLKDDPRRVEQSGLRADFLQWTMLGELLEECYDENEFAVNRTENWIEHIRAACERHAVSTSSPVFTGIAYDLLNLRPEVCAYVEVDRQRTKRPEITLSWEYTPHEGVTEIVLDPVDPLVRRTEFVQAGAACLALAKLSYEARERDESVSRPRSAGTC